MILPRKGKETYFSLEGRKEKKKKRREML